jgi:hypothetical protein
MLDLESREIATNVHKVKQFANGADRTLDGEDIADPGRGRMRPTLLFPRGRPLGDLFYKDFSGLPLFAANGPSELDVDQNRMGDCWLLSVLGNTARTNPNAIRQTVVALGDGTYAIELGGEFYRVDADLPTTSDASTTLRFAGLGQQGSIWVPIVEKAYAFYRPAALTWWTETDTYGTLDGGWPREVFEALGHSGYVGRSFTNASEALTHIASELARGKVVVVNIQRTVTGSPAEGPHAYMVEPNGVNYQTLQIGSTRIRVPVSVVLRNPHGPNARGYVVTVTGQQLVSGMYQNGRGIESAWVV